MDRNRCQEKTEGFEILDKTHLIIIAFWDNRQDPKNLFEIVKK